MTLVQIVMIYKAIIAFQLKLGSLVLAFMFVDTMPICSEINTRKSFFRSR